MKTTIYYYTGTGNSLWVARAVAEGLGETNLVSIPDCRDDELIGNSDTIGLIFPVHIWGCLLPSSDLRGD